MRFRLRTGELAAIFELYMLGVVLAAAKNALDATGPWYQETVSLWVYATTFLAALLLLLVLGVAVLILVRPRGLSFVLPPSESAGHRNNPIAEVATEEVEDLLRSLEETAAVGRSPGDVEAEVEEIPEIPPYPAASERRTEASRLRRVVTPLTAPIVMALIFLSASSALLPASAGILQHSHFALNTFFVLTFAYAWPGLLAYTVASLFLAAREA